MKVLTQPFHRHLQENFNSTWKRPHVHSTFEIQLKIQPSICKGLELPKQLSGLYWELRRKSSSGSWNLTVIILFCFPAQPVLQLLFPAGGERTALRD